MPERVDLPPDARHVVELLLPRAEISETCPVLIESSVFALRTVGRAAPRSRTGAGAARGGTLRKRCPNAVFSIMET